MQAEDVITRPLVSSSSIASPIIPRGLNEVHNFGLTLTASAAVESLASTSLLPVSFGNTNTNLYFKGWYTNVVGWSESQDCHFATRLGLTRLNIAE